LIRIELFSFGFLPVASGGIAALCLFGRDWEPEKAGIMLTFDTSDLASRYSKRLAIIVPYRNRAEHLARFLPHMAAYFQREKLDKQIDMSIHIVEQNGTDPFNRGRLANCGFMLTRDNNDYIVVHDVDYLPIWSDYSWSAMPLRLIWHGLSRREDWSNFFGAIVLFDNAAFEKVNGFPNCYWGWGPEDLELGQRCKLTGIGYGRRDGTYERLPHQENGYLPRGGWTDEARETHKVFDQRRLNLAAFIESDGLRTLKYSVIDKKPLTAAGQPLPNSYHYIVDIGRPENAPA
jgi:xylosylprotein 4-beta-galactosyltransferase